MKYRTSTLFLLTFAAGAFADLSVNTSMRPLRPGEHGAITLEVDSSGLAPGCYLDGLRLIPGDFVSPVPSTIQNNRISALSTNIPGNTTPGWAIAVTATQHPTEPLRQVAMRVNCPNPGYHATLVETRDLSLVPGQVYTIQVRGSSIPPAGSPHTSRAGGAPGPTRETGTQPSFVSVEAHDL